MPSSDLVLLLRYTHAVIQLPVRSGSDLALQHNEHAFHLNGNLLALVDFNYL